MYSILHETDDATSVNFSVWGEFLPRKGKQLATAGAKALKFYRLSPYSTGNGQSTSKLECFLSFTLMAPIRGMTVVRLQDYFECDALALTFDDAKISIVNINPATMSLNTLSLHSLEDDFLRDGYSKDIYCPELRVDPESRCCAFTVYGRHLAIVPFQKHHRVNRVTNNQMGRGALQIMLQSYSIKFRSLDARLENVHDLCFLHGYYEPTLLFLYEPIQTTAGRACVRYDTVCILGVSLNLKDRLHAIVWNFSGLPLTVDRCLPIRQPLGGVCLFGANEIVYLNQSVPPHGISLNSCSDEYSRLPLSCKQQNMRITLDGCAVQTLPDIPNDILVISREGHLYILTLETDQANVVRGMQLKQTFETSIPCTLSVCSSNLLFVGSRLGDSQLLHFDWQQRKPSNDLNTALFNNHSRILFDDDDYFLYGEEFCQNFVMEESLTQAVRMYNFKLVDTLPNVGPCKWLRTCAPNDISDAFRKNPSDIYFDMMTTSGHGKDSSLCFFQRTIRPQIVTSTFLEGAQRIWTVGKRPDGTQQYLVISRERSTNVLELANDMVELDAEIFCYTESTILAGDMANGMISMQITPTSIVLVANGQQIDMMAVDSNFPVISASIMDPFIVLLTLNGRFFLYQLISNDNSFNLQQVPALELLKHDKSPISSIVLYKDQSGLIQMCTENIDQEHQSTEQTASANSLDLDSRMFSRSLSFQEDQQQGKIMKRELMETSATIQEEDEIETWLYGPSEKNYPQQNLNLLQNEKGQSVNSADDDDRTRIAQTESSYLLFLARENGNLYIYSVPELRLVYMVRKFSQTHDLLYNDAKSAFDDENYRAQQQGFTMNTSPAILPQTVTTTDNRDISVKPEEAIMELQVHGMGKNGDRPMLSALIDDMVIFYEMFPFDDKIPGYLAIRFRRLPCTVVIRENRFLGTNGRASVEATRDSENRNRQYICPFKQIGHLSNGIFVAGNYPSILVMGRGEPRLHPMTIDGQITSFAQFNNANYKHSFLYLTKKTENFMRIARINSNISYDYSYPFRKIPIGQTIHQAVFMLQSEIIAIVTSVKKPNKTLCNVVNEEKQVEIYERDNNFILPHIDAYTLRLFSTEDWNFVPNGDFELEEFEVSTCCEEVLLSSESTVSGVKNYLALGTSLNYGEEVYVRGRVVLFELIEVVPEEGMPTTRHRLKTIYDKEQKGPVTSLCAINGFLLTGMGQKVFIWQFRDNQLHGVSFLDLHFYVHHMISFREFALACDLYRSLSLIRYQEEFKALSLVSRDLRPTAPPPMTANFLVDHKQIGFMLTDELSNITLFNFLPEMKESIGGERLIIRAALNIGSLVNSTVRIRGHTSECFVDGEYQFGTHTCYFATLDGSFGFIRPLTEKIFRRLHMLQQVMNIHVPQPAGLNPRGSRSARPQKTGTNQQIGAAKNIVDGLLVTQYFHLSCQEKTDLARKLGTSRYQILDDLTELSRTVTHY